MDSDAGLNQFPGQIVVYQPVAEEIALVKRNSSKFNPTNRIPITKSSSFRFINGLKSNSRKEFFKNATINGH
jgi:hypothetical protein